MKRIRGSKCEIDLTISSPSKHKKINKEHKAQIFLNKHSIKRTFRSGHLRDFTENTSLHGFKYLGEKNKYIDKIWWSVMIILSLLICGYLINSLWKKWNNTLVIVSFAETSTPIWEIPFPAITICSNVQIPKSRYNYTEKCLSRFNFTDEELSYHNSISLLCNLGCGYEEEDFVNETSIDNLMNITTQLKELFDRCLWSSKLNKCHNMFNPILTDEGVCYTFNMLSSKELYEEDTMQNQYNFSKNEINEGWDIEKGYDENLPLQTYPRRRNAIGILSGFKLDIKILNNELDIRCGGYLTGLKIAFHPPNVIPRVSEHFHWISINQDYMYSIKPSMMTTSPMVKSYSPERRKCYYQDEKKLKFFKNYTHENCQLECLTNFTMAVCGCAAYYMPRNANMSICSSKKKYCVLNVAANIFLIQTRTYLKKTFNNENISWFDRPLEVIKKCDCLPSCISIKYEVETSQTNLNIPDFLKAKWNLTWEPASVTFYFKESHFITTRRSELYGLVDFLANCGGLLGVCLGFSILSLVEIIYFMTIRLFNYVKHNKVIANSDAN